MQVEVCVNMRKQCGTDDTTITTAVNNYCQRCVRCRVAKEPTCTPKFKTYMSHAITAARPLEIVAITIPTRDQTAKTVSRLFVREWIQKLGVPERMYTAITKAGLLKTKLSNNYVISSKEVQNDTLPSSGKLASRTI